jgi:hypothetical protein
MLDSSQIEKMSMAERLRAMERLWDAVRHEGEDGEEIPSPAWHGKVLADRKARAKQGKAKFLTLDQLRSRLQGSES